MANSKILQTWQIEEINNGNLAFDASYGIMKKQYLGGLSNYTQSNCQVTLTDSGYRIYRPPNLNPTDNGNTMWGGFVLSNSGNRFGLIQGHTYVIEFDIKGQSSTATPDIYWTNMVGWGGGGLNPVPTGVVTCNPVTSNWQSSDYQHFSYKWTCDSIYKTCTSAYHTFVQGNSYLSYAGFKYGWGYANTGSLGTDVYIKNLRMYDITGQTAEIDMSKSGIKCLEIIENIEPVQFNRNGGIECNELIEL